MHAKSIKIGVLAGILAGGLAAFAMTLLDWWKNPAGLFHDAGGTHWNIVVETATSWFWPVALLCFVVACAWHYWLTRSESAGDATDR